MHAKTYLEPGAQGPIVTENQRIGDLAYGEVVNKMPIPCTDVVFFLPGDLALYLAKRNIKPHPRVWVIGGRIFFNDETLEASAARCVKRETGFDIDPKKLLFIGSSLYAWSETAQGGVGKNLVVTFAYPISPADRATISSGLIGSEYVQDFGLQRFDENRLKEGNCHPALIDMLRTIFRLG